MSTTTVNAEGVEFEIEIGGRERHSRLARTRHWYMMQAEDVDGEKVYRYLTPPDKTRSAPHQRVTR